MELRQSHAQMAPSPRLPQTSSDQHHLHHNAKHRDISANVCACTPVRICSAAAAILITAPLIRYHGGMDGSLQGVASTSAIDSGRRVAAWCDIALGCRVVMSACMSVRDVNRRVFGIGGCRLEAAGTYISLGIATCGTCRSDLRDHFLLSLLR